MTQQTEIVVSVALNTASNGHLLNRTESDMEYMLGYHEIDYDSAMDIIEQTSDYAARKIPTLQNPTETDFDIIVNISDRNPNAHHRIDLDVYSIHLHGTRRVPFPTEKDDICPICYDEFGVEGEVNTLICGHSFHHQCILDWVTKTLTCPNCRTALD